MIFSPRILLGLLMAMGIVSGILQAGPRYGQRYTPVADIGLEDPPSLMEIKCSDTPGIRRKDLKPYIEDFCINYVHSQPRDVGEIDKEYTIIDPWSQWKVKFTWSTKQLWAERNCEASYKAMTRKKACGMFRTKGRKVAVAMKAFGEEHPGPESYSWVLTPPQEPDMTDEAEVEAEAYDHEETETE